MSTLMYSAMHMRLTCWKQIFPFDMFKKYFKCMVHNIWFFMVIECRNFIKKLYRIS